MGFAFQAHFQVFRFKGQKTEKIFSHIVIDTNRLLPSLSSNQAQ